MVSPALRGYEILKSELFVTTFVEKNYAVWQLEILPKCLTCHHHHPVGAWPLRKKTWEMLNVEMLRWSSVYFGSYQNLEWGSCSFPRCCKTATLNNINIAEFEWFAGQQSLKMQLVLSVWSEASPARTSWCSSSEWRTNWNNLTK